MWSIVYYLVAAFISMAISYLLMPKTKVTPQQSVAENPGDAEMPTADEGNEIPVYFGVVWCRDANIAWWGDTEVIARTYQEAVQGTGGGGGKK